MKFGSVCSGIEAASVAWEPLGWQCAWVSEIDPFCCDLLEHRFPHIPNYGDTLKLRERFRDEPTDIDLLVGGTPCQPTSVAGKRGGMDDPRFELTREYVRLVDQIRPTWFVWENPPGILSINGGRVFTWFIRSLEKLRYGVFWRVLDAQYYGVPQRRKRVFAVGYLGDWRPSCAVLLEPESLRRDIAPSRETKEEVTETLTSRTTGGSVGNSFDTSGGVVKYEGASRESAGVDTGEDREGGGVVETLDTSLGHHGGATTVQSAVAGHFVAYGGNRSEGELDVATTLSAHGGPHGRLDFASETFIAGDGVRRLTPMECERLQGFPDGWTAVEHRGKRCKDGPRYRALGNSMAVPVMKWIGERIELCDSIIKRSQ